MNVCLHDVLRMCKWHPGYNNESKANVGCFIFLLVLTMMSIMLHCTNFCNIAICSFHHHQLFVCTKCGFFCVQIFFLNLNSVLSPVCKLPFTEQIEILMNKKTSQKQYCVIVFGFEIYCITQYVYIHCTCNSIYHSPQ